jgi:hypothetical protein
MALSRISDLITGTVPIIGTALFEVSVPNAGAPSGYDSRKFTLTNVLSTAVAKAGDTMTGGLMVNGVITQGVVTNSNASFQGIASISSAYNEIAVYGAGAGAGAIYCAVGADAANGYLYAGNNANLHIETKGAGGGIYFDTGATTTTRMSIDATGTTVLSTKTVIQSDTNQLWIKSLNNTIAANLVMECVGVHIYSLGVGTSGNWLVYDNTANRPCLTVSTLGDLNVQHDITAANTIYANNWVYLFGGLRCRNNANTTWLDIYDDGNTHLESTTQLWLNSNNKPTIVGGALTTHAVTSTITGQTTTNTDTTAPINLILDDAGAGVGSGGGLIFSASTGAWKFAAIKGYVTGGGGNSIGCVYLTTRRNITDTVLTPTAMFNEVGTCYNTTGSWSVFSERSLKQDIEPYERGLDAIVKLSPVQFRYQPGTLFTTEDTPSRVLYGLLADEVQPHIPEICDSLDLALDDNIDGEKRTIATLNPTDLVYCLINAVKELHAEIENMKSRLH